MLTEMRSHFCCLELISDGTYVWDIRGIQRDSPKHEFVWLSGRTSHWSLGNAIEAAYNFWKATAKRTARVDRQIGRASVLLDEMNHQGD